MDIRLTKMETRTVRLVLEGYTDKEIAFELQRSEACVRQHLHNVYVKTRCRNRVGLVLMVQKQGGIKICTGLNKSNVDNLPVSAIG